MGMLEKGKFNPAGQTRIEIYDFKRTTTLCLAYFKRYTNASAVAMVTVAVASARFLCH